MTPDDTQEFFDIWDQCAEVYSKTVSEGAKALAFKLLAKYSMQQIKSALRAHMTDPDAGRFMVKPADVVAKIQILSPSGYIGAEQAWAQFPRDETQSACICEEMAKAWGIACELDDISGRMAFKEAYEREVAASKARGNSPKWFITTGSDKQQVETVTLDAVRDRLISPSAASRYLPHIDTQELERLANGDVTVNNLQLENTQTVVSLEQLMLSAPVSSKEEAINNLAELRKLLA